MSFCCKRVHKMLRAFDLFPTSQFLRYRGEPQYSTATGGFTSILVIAICIALFASEGVQTARKQIITSTSSVEIEGDPSTIKFTSEEGSGFSVGFAIQGLNINDPNVTYFDIQLGQVFQGPNFTVINATSIPLQPCTPQRFVTGQVSIELLQTFGVEQWKCPQADYEFTLGGKIASQLYSFFVLQVSRCNPNITSNCAPDADIAAIEAAVGEFRLATVLVTSVINPSDQLYHSLFLEDRNGYTFTTTQGLRCNVYVEEAYVDTDNSLLPMEDVTREKFKRVPDMFQTMPMSTSKGVYAEVNFRKSSAKHTYTRSFNKVDNYFSYVGGLIGTIIGFIFIMHFFSQRAYDISIASRLFLDDDGKAISSGGFNILYMVSLFIWNACEFVGCCRPNWTKTELYSKCIDEIDQQLDVALLIKKVQFCEKAISLLFNEHQLQAMHLQEKYTLKEASKVRKKYELSQKMNEEGEESSMTPHQNEISQIELEAKAKNNLSKSSENDSGKEASLSVMAHELSVSQVSRVSSTTKERVRTNLIKVVVEAQKGNPVSARIAESIDPKYKPSMCKDNNLKIEDDPKEVRSRYRNGEKRRPKRREKSKVTKEEKVERQSQIIDHDFEIIASPRVNISEPVEQEHE